MADEFNHDVVGKDGIKPSYNPEGRWNPGIALHELYQGENGGRDDGTGKKVPLYVGNVRDYVTDVYNHVDYYIKALNLETLVPELELRRQSGNILTPVDILTARGPSFGAADCKITIDTSVFPHRLDTSPFLEINSVEASYAKIIKGPLNGAHRVVGFMATTAGQLVDDVIPLDLIRAVADGVTNYHQKNVRVCYCNEKFSNGDILNVVLYSSGGKALSENQLVVVDSSFVRDGNAPREYIKAVYVESPYLSPSNPFVLEVPVGWTNSSINMIGVIEYQNGRKVKLPLDDKKFYLEGLNQLLSSIAGQTMSWVLKYRLDPGEQSMQNALSVTGVVPQVYRVKVVKPNNSYNVKIYAFPVWNATVNGYRLRYFLVNLERNMLQDVTAAIRVVDGTAAFDGFSYGFTQRIQVALNLQDVSSTYKPFVFTQILEVTLYGTPGERRDPWIVKQSHQDTASIGKDIWAQKSTDGRTFSVKGRFTTKEDWLQALFHNGFPLLSDPNIPKSYPLPTHFMVGYGGKYEEYAIDEWDKDLVFPSTFETHRNLELVWKHKTATEDLIISVTSILIQMPE